LQFKEGVEQAVADINDAGGILGQKSPSSSSARPDAR
jgi:ABC-type branched-subunit amino acid transport system substrate-binding protein